MRLPSHGVDHCPDETRLADACFAGEDNDLALAGLGPPPALQHQRQFMIPADERRHCPGSSSLEPALARPLAKDGEGWRLAGDALEFLFTEVAEGKDLTQ